MISVVVPVKNGGSDLIRCLSAIQAQQTDEEVEVVVVDSGSTDGSPDRARALGASVHEIAAEEFGHGRTRNLGASLARGDVIAFTSQDAAAVDDEWLARLAAAARSGHDVAGAYGRQLPHPDARPPERFFLDFLYGPARRVQRAVQGVEPTFETTLFSNANSAIPRAVLDRLPFGHDVAMSEDQEWSRRALAAGLALVYEPLAAVRHSHRYTIHTAFDRFYDSGVSAEHAFAAGREGQRAIGRAGIRYAREEVGWLWRTGQRRWLPYAAVYELAKFAGIQLGMHHRRLPTGVARRLGTLSPPSDPTGARGERTAGEA